MEDRRATKIPAPPRALQEINFGVPERSSRKRKAGSPLKAAPEVKKQAGSAGPVNAPSGQAEESWEQVQEETGWSLVACLGHKLSFTKRQDTKTKSEALLAHVKRLRAAGWHLHTLTERYELDVQALKGALEREEAARAAEAAQHATALAGVQGSLERAEAGLAEEGVAKAVMGSKVAQLVEELDSRNGQLKESNTAISKLQGEHQQAREHLAASVAQVHSLSDLHQQAQKYNAQLQEYNGKLQQEISSASQGLMKLQAEKHTWAEEQATLRGKLAAAEGQLQALQDTSTVTEKGRQEHAEDAARLRLQLAQVVQARDTAATECAALRAELERFRECTGKSVEALEQEKACRAKLQGLNQAQTELNQGLIQEVEMLRQGKSLMESLALRRGAQVVSLQAQVEGLTSKLAAAESEVQEGELLRRRLHNTLLELKGNIRVFCRVRPMLGDEGASSNASQLVQFPAQGDLMGRGVELHIPGDGKSQQPQKHEYAFDKVFAPAATQQEVFEEITQLVQSALDGYKVCIFAYGQTGSGKTHTMLGTEGDPGVIPRAMEQVFASSKALEAKGWTFEMRASMLEIYNEEYKDLLGKGPPTGKKHQVSHDDKGCTSVSFLEGVDVRCPGRVADLLARATRQRAVGATALNERSSRSHMAFMLTIAGGNPATGQHVQGVLNLIDLAGSERLSRSLASGDRLKETQAINKSLSSLGDVIVALANKEAHVPYRNSKLTYLLQHCLGGDAKTLMFVNIAPVPEAVNESVCSLRFAAKVNACVVGTAKRNVAGT